MKKKKTWILAVLAGAAILTLTACQGAGNSGSTSGADQAKSSSVQNAETETSVAEYKVAMITDSGDITDQSFNQTTYETCKAFCEKNGVEFIYKKPSGDTDDARIAMVDAAIGEGCNVIILPGYVFGSALVECSPMYPDVKFIALDLSEGDILSAALGDEYDYNPDNWNAADYYNTENSYCTVYQEELPGYMAGYAAVKMGYTKLGYLGGLSVPSVMRFGYGYLQGIDAAAKELGITDDITVQYAYGGQFYGSPEITAAMDTWYQNGTEVVFNCGAGIYTSIAEAAAKTGGKVIGVDTDQAPIIDVYGENMTITSAMKNLEATLNSALESIIITDTWSERAGKIERLGIISRDNLDLNYVKLSDSTKWCDSFTEEDYKALVGDIASGKIEVSSDISTFPDVSVKVNVREGTIM